jgi:WG repeat protein
VRVGDEETGQYGYIDTQGKMVIEPQFAFADLFSASDGLAAVRTGTKTTGKFGYIAQ